MKQVNEVTGKTEEIFAKPIHSQDAELVRQRLLEYGNIEIIGLGYDNDGRLQHIVPFSEEMTEIVLKKANGDIITVSVDAFFPESQVPTHVLALNENPIRLVVPEAELRFYDWYCNPEDELAYMQYAKLVGEEFFLRLLMTLTQRKVLR